MDYDTSAWITLSLRTPQILKKEMKFLSSIHIKIEVFDLEEREFLMGWDVAKSALIFI